MDAATAEAPDRNAPRFVTGSTLRHVAVMTATSSVGLIAIFAVDFLSLLYISWLGDPRLTAGVGLATIVLFLATSANVGLMIAISALVSRALGARERDKARRLAGSCFAHTIVAAVLISAIILLLLPWLLPKLGASSETMPVAQRFLWITLPSNFLMAAGMGFSAVLRGVGDAKRAMYVTLSGGIVTAALDPILIFGFGLGTDGAAIATVVSRIIFAYAAFRGAVHVHRLVGRPSLAEVIADTRPMYGIALPAMLTNVATPVAGAFFAATIAQFGDQAIAANAVVDRLVPVAFGGLFALSGAVGPILGQNWGAGHFDRMRGALRDSVMFAAVYVGAIWLGLIILRQPLTSLFNVTGSAAEILEFFCLISGPVWFFNGLLFVANASFNNLGFPLLSTAFNWGRATLGIIPFAVLGARWAGPQGAFAGVGIGSLIFGLAAVAVAFWTIGRLERNGRSRCAAASI